MRSRASGELPRGLPILLNQSVIVLHTWEWWLPNGWAQWGEKKKYSVLCPLRASISLKARDVLSLVYIFSRLYGEESREDDLLTQKHQTCHQSPQVGLAFFRKVMHWKPVSSSGGLVTRNLSVSSLKLGIQGGNANALGNKKVIKVVEPLNVKKSWEQNLAFEIKIILVSLLAWFSHEDSAAGQGGEAWAFPTEAVRSAPVLLPPSLLLLSFQTFLLPSLPLPGSWNPMSSLCSFRPEAGRATLPLPSLTSPYWFSNWTDSWFKGPIKFHHQFS